MPVVVSYIPGALLEIGSSNARILECKFVVVRRPSQTHLVIGRVRDYKYHAHLIDRFCREQDIPSGRIPGSDTIEIYDHGVRIEGGGKADIDPARGSVRCYGHSAAYGPYPVPDVRQAFAEDPFWRQFAVELDSRS